MFFNEPGAEKFSTGSNLISSRSATNIQDVEISNFSSGWKLPVLSTGPDCDPLKPKTKDWSMYFRCAALQVQTDRCSWNFYKSVVTEQGNTRNSKPNLALYTFGFLP
jgi:hypothetical protein